MGAVEKTRERRNGLLARPTSRERRLEVSMIVMLGGSQLFGRVNKDEVSVMQGCGISVRPSLSERESCVTLTKPANSVTSET